MGARLRTIREIVGLSQAAVAEIAGVGATTINGWESGRNQIDVASLAWIARHLGISTDYVILGDVGSLKFDLATRVQAASRAQLAAGPRPRGRPPGVPTVRDVPDAHERDPNTTLHDRPTPYLPPPKSHSR